MSLYGRTDSNTNKTKAERNIASSSQAKQIIFVDNTEAALSENKQRGIDAPGWWSYFTYTDTEGNTRHKAELLVTIADPDSNANETQTDDTVAADVASAITISAQPTNQTTDDAVAAATFAVTAAATTGSLVYQWQFQSATGTRWSNITGETGSSLALSGLTLADSGKKYRVKITSTAGAEEVISNTATLTVTAA
jgi:hypothetical protein